MSDTHEHYAREIYVETGDNAGGWGYLPQILERQHSELIAAVNRIAVLEDDMRKALTLIVTLSATVSAGFELDMLAGDGGEG